MSIQEYTKAKAFAHFEKAWKTCPHRTCNKRKTCTGGPRGSYRKLGSKLLCKTVTPLRRPTCKMPETLTLSHSDFLKDSHDRDRSLHPKN